MAETSFKTLIERFRSRPEWQHPDPAVRAEAVLRLPASDHELVLALAREDEDPHVRRAAVKRLSEVAVLAEIAGRDADAHVREEAAGRLVHIALNEHDEAQARAAVAGLNDAKSLTLVAKGAALASLREAAVHALSDARALASVVREAEDSRTRLLALGRIEDGQTLLALAQNLEQKALAVAAVDRLSDPEALRQVAAKARVPAAARRARSRLETGEPAVPAAPLPPPPVDDEAEQRAYEEARAALERETAEAREREAAARAVQDEAERVKAEEALAASQKEHQLEQTQAETQAELRARARAEKDALAEKEKAHAEALAALASRAEALVAKGAHATLRDTDHALREIKEALAQPGSPKRRERDQLLARLEAARRQLYPLLQQLREDTEWKRWANVSVQEELAARAEALVGESNLDRAASTLHELDRRWRQAKEAPKDKGEALWTRFKAAHDQVKARVDEHLAKQAAHEAENLAKREALSERAESLADSSDWVKTAEALRALQAEWKTVGAVPRTRSQRSWERFRKACDRFFTRFEEHRSERGREWEQNFAKKAALCEQAEALAASTQWEEAAAGVKKLQADWRTIGPVKKSKADAIWQRFRTACDLFFDRYKNRDAHAREAAQKAREGICAELEALVPADEPLPEPPSDLVARVLAAQTAWRQAGSLPQEELKALDARFLRARDRLFEAHAAAFQGSELDPEAIRRRAEKLVTRLEALLAGLAPKAASAAESGADLAARLRDALASNTIGGREALEQRWQSAANELETIETAWRRLGLLPGAEGRALAERFEQAARRFAQERPKVEHKPEPKRPERPRRDPRRDRPERGRR
ncbi:MAG TPA: DUF349 domain-containing protein [Vicinamibacteria bacterium]